MRGQKPPILTIAFAVVLLAFASLVVVSAVSELTSKGSCTTGATIKVWQGDFEFSHSCVRNVTINPHRAIRPKAIRPRANRRTLKP
jgi:hypothetical protein